MGWSRGGTRRAGGLAALVCLAALGSAQAARTAAPTPALGGAGGRGPLASVMLQGTVRLSTSRVTLGQVSVLETTDLGLAERLDQLDLGRAPVTGLVRVIPQDYVRLVLRKEGLPEGKIWLGGEPVVRIQRATQRLGAEWIQERVLEFLARQLGREADPGVRFRNLRTPGEIEVPAGEVELRVGLRGAAREGEALPAGRLALALEFLVDGVPARTGFAQVDIERYGPALRLARPIAAGRLIAEGDVEVILEDLSRVPADVVASPADLAGRVARTALPAGRTLRASMLSTPAVVKRGDVLKAVVSGGGMQVTALVEAREDGNAGQWIRALNRRSGKEISVRVVDHETAVVEVPE